MHAAAVRTLTLWALLALPGGARAGPPRRRRTNISYKTTSMDTFEASSGSLDVSYGEDITVLCTAADTLSLTIQIIKDFNTNATNLKTEVVNSTTIRCNISRPDVGCYEYRCVNTIDMDTTDLSNRETLSLSVVPRVSVVAAGVHHVQLSGERSKFFVPCGETYLIFCTGNEAKSFELIEISSILEYMRTPAVAVNETTVTYEKRANRLGTHYYFCSCEADARFNIIVDYPPEVQEFQCTWCYEEMVCTWSSLSPANTFNLFYEDHFTPMKLICRTNKECKWKQFFLFQGLSYIHFDVSLEFIMQTCNSVYCHNQTFPMKLSSISKLDPVSIRTINKSARAAVVTWRPPKEGLPYHRNVYKMEYRLLQKRWRQADTSSVRCDDDQCELEVKLDCPEQHYELRVYARLKEAADERLWSEPASATFYTAPAADDAPAPACRAALQEPDPVSREMAVRKLFKLIEHTIKRKSVFRKQVRNLQPKLDQVKSLMASLAALNGDVEASDSTR